MPREFQAILDAIGDFFGSPVVSLAIQALALYAVILWLAAAYWAFRDVQQRSDNPILPYLASAFIIVFTPLFFLFAVVIYRLIRPHERIGEVYERNLAEEALLADIEKIAHCPTCGRKVHDEWIICPTCRTRLHRVCPNCSRLVGVDWSICAWCGRDFERRDAATIATIPAVRPALAEPAATPALPMVTALGTPTATPEPTPPNRRAIRAGAARTPMSRPRSASARSPELRAAPDALPEP